MPGARTDYLSEEHFEKIKNYLIMHRDVLNMENDDDFYMMLALLVSNCSRDPSSQVGAVVVGKTNGINIITYGYNRAVKGMSDDAMPWDSIGEKTGEKAKIKNYFVTHAEMDAINKYKAMGIQSDDVTLYVTWSPCNECAKVIAENGIKKVIYHRTYSKTDMNAITYMIFKNAGVEFELIGEDISKDEQKELVLRITEKYKKIINN